MAETKFIDLVKKYFRYLADKYGFSVANEETNLQTYGDRLVEFRSPTTVVIVTDEGNVRVELGPVSEPRVAQFSLTNVLGYLAPEVIAEKLPFYFTKSYERNLETQVAQLAYTLREYCEPMLRGDFSVWNDVGKNIFKGANKYYKAKTGKELGEDALSLYLKSKGVILPNEG